MIPETNTPHCRQCGEEIVPADRYYTAGYTTCLECGEQDANDIMEYRKSCIAPMCSKGTYTYIADRSQAIGIHAKSWVDH